MQIRTRLTLLFLSVSAAVLAAVLVFAYFLYQRSTIDAFFNGLRNKADMTKQTILRNQEALQPLPNDWPEPDDGALPYTDNISIYNDHYERVFSLLNAAAPVPLKVLQDAFTQEEIRFEHYNLHALGQHYQQGKYGNYVVVVEGFCDTEPLRKLRNILIVSFLVGMACMACLGWFLSGLALRPLNLMMNEVDAMQPNDLRQRISPGKNQDELHRLALTFNRLLDRIEQAFRAQRMFISNVSHELKNPLSKVRTQIDVSLNRKRDADAYEQTLRSISDDLREMSDMEEKLLQLARIHNAPEAITMQPVRLDELLWQARDQLQKHHEGARATIGLDNLPEQDECLWVQANEALLRMAILNLMDNAVKYSPDKSVHVRAHFDPNGHHNVEIIDNGPGIPPHELPLIFEPFFRSDRHRQVKGTGIGLSLVKSILALHHIRLTVNSPISGGTVFGLHWGNNS